MYLFIFVHIKYIKNAIFKESINVHEDKDLALF